MEGEQVARGFPINILASRKPKGLEGCPVSCQFSFSFFLFEDSRGKDPAKGCPSAPKTLSEVATPKDVLSIFRFATAAEFWDRGEPSGFCLYPCGQGIVEDEEVSVVPVGWDAGNPDVFPDLGPVEGFLGLMVPLDSSRQ